MVRLHASLASRPRFKSRAGKLDSGFHPKGSDIGEALLIDKWVTAVEDFEVNRRSGDELALRPRHNGVHPPAGSRPTKVI
jgi:hypothetical protein